MFIVYYYFFNCFALDILLFTSGLKPPFKIHCIAVRRDDQTQQYEQYKFLLDIKFMTNKF
jgi:hypothetical protein